MMTIIVSRLQFCRRIIKRNTSSPSALLLCRVVRVCLCTHWKTPLLLPVQWLRSWRLLSDEVMVLVRYMFQHVALHVRLSIVMDLPQHFSPSESRGIR